MNSSVRACARRVGVAAVAAWGMTLPAFAQTVPPPQNVVSLSASATVDAPQDWLTVVFSTTRQAADAATVQAQLKQALDKALTEAKGIAAPGQVEVHTGGFSLSPRYAAPDPRGPNAGQAGSIVGWQGSTELIVEGRDTPAIAKLTGRIQTLSIARVGFSLSREARQQLEGEVTAQAIDRFRASADAVVRRFGFSGYGVREVNVSSDQPIGRAVPMMRVQAMSAAADAPLPVEAGRTSVSATVSGSVQMK